MISNDSQGDDDPQAAADATAQDQPHESKSQRKRQAQALQILGKRLAELKPDVRAQFDLPDALEHAITQYNRFRSNEARRRQLQYIGKQMRKLDTTPIIKQLEVVDGHAVSVKQELHHLERWREQLLGDNAALTDFINQYPETDRQTLRNLVRKARREAEQEKTAVNPQSASANKTARELLRYLRSVVQTQQHDQA